MSAKKPKLTKWFDGRRFVPYYVGEYNASLDRNPWCMRWWDGKFWRIEKGGSLCVVQNRDWRGLAQKPEVQP